MCADSVIDGVNKVNKGQKAALTVNIGPVHTRFLSFIVSLLSWPVRHRNVNTVEVSALVCSNNIKPGK